MGKRGKHTAGRLLGDLELSLQTRQEDDSAEPAAMEDVPDRNPGRTLPIDSAPEAHTHTHTHTHTHEVLLDQSAVDKSVGGGRN